MFTLGSLFVLCNSSRSINGQYRGGVSAAVGRKEVRPRLQDIGQQATGTGRLVEGRDGAALLKGKRKYTYIYIQPHIEIDNLTLAL